MFSILKPNTVKLGDKRVPIPKLTIAKWKLLFAEIGSLPNIISDVLQARDTVSFSATLTVAFEMAADDVLRIVSVLTDEPVEWLEEQADPVQIIDFIVATANYNNLGEAAKKYRAAFAKWMASPAAPMVEPSPSTNG